MIQSNSKLDILLCKLETRNLKREAYYFYVSKR